MYNGIRYITRIRSPDARGGRGDQIFPRSGHGEYFQPAQFQRGSTRLSGTVVARRKIDQLNAALSLASLRIPPGNQLQALIDNRRGQHSIRINDQFRVCFAWTDEGPERVEITDYH